MSVDDGLRALLRSRVPPPGQWTTIETGGRGDGGVPDCYWLASVRRRAGVEFNPPLGVGVWIECKSVRRGWAVRFQPAQVGWLTTHARHGGRCVVAVRRRLRSDDTDELYLYPGADARLLVECGLQAGVWDAPQARQGVRGAAALPRPLGYWRGGPSRWSWTEIRDALVGA